MLAMIVVNIILQFKCLKRIFGLPGFCTLLSRSTFQATRVFAGVCARYKSLPLLMVRSAPNGLCCYGFSQTAVATAGVGVSRSRFLSSPRGAVREEGGGIEDDDFHMSHQSIDDVRLVALDNALEEVHEHGWTEDAIAAGLSKRSIPLSLTGLVTGKGSELVAFFMDKCNKELQRRLKAHEADWDERKLSVAERLRASIRMRLTMVTPFIRSNRWHEAMATGALQPAITASQLERLVCIILESGCKVQGGLLEKTTVGAVYAAAELHMLSDRSDTFEDTWLFLDRRVSELEMLATQSTGSKGVLNSGDFLFAASSVVSSLGTAILSLAQPAARGAVTFMAPSMIRQITSVQEKTQDDTSVTNYSQNSQQQGRRNEYNKIP